MDLLKLTKLELCTFFALQGVMANSEILKVCDDQKNSTEYLGKIAHGAAIATLEVLKKEQAKNG